MQLRWVTLLWTLAVVLGLCGFGSRPASAGKLGSVRNEVRGGSPSRASRPPPATTSSRPRSPAPRPVRTTRPTARTSTRTVTTRPYTAGTVVISRCPERHCPAPPAPPPRVTRPRYPHYPYEPGNEGYIRRVPERDATQAGLAAGRVGLEAGYMADGVWRGGGGLELYLWRFGLVSDLHLYVEMPHFARPTDAMYLGDTWATFDVVMRPHLSVRIGPGVSYMVDGRTPGEGRRDYAAGPSIMGAVDVFPVKPLVMTLRLDRGRLYKADTFGVRATAGIILDRYELYAGYEYKRVGDVGLYGPQLGVRAWF